MLIALNPKVTLISRSCKEFHSMDVILAIQVEYKVYLWYFSNLHPELGFGMLVNNEYQ